MNTPIAMSQRLLPSDTFSSVQLLLNLRTNLGHLLDYLRTVDRLASHMRQGGDGLLMPILFDQPVSDISSISRGLHPQEETHHLGLSFKKHNPINIKPPGMIWIATGTRHCFVLVGIRRETP